MPTLTTLLALVAPILANPTLCDIDPRLALTADGQHVEASFATVCERGGAPEISAVVQVWEGVAWRTLPGRWEKAGTRNHDGGSGLEPYQVYRQQVACPAEGTFAFRMTEPPLNLGDIEVSAHLRCSGAGQPIHG
jgi:hypothetical protein